MTEPPLPTRRGPRVRLDFPQESDGAELMALNRASRTFYRGLASPLVTPEGFARYLERCRRPDYAGLLLRRRLDDAILGSVNVSEIVRGIFQSAYLGYQIGAPFARQGYMTEGLGLVLHYVFVQLKLHRLEANIQPANRPSLALAARLGFVQEGFSRRYLKICGRWRDHERWAILAEDWRAGLKE
ncbi:MAG TPA: GNAT family N-acetyltransferase [Thermoanaerobaculia bacterium]|nr:GNAT family N-acetyltransferase [Thermoanaerobaculia bacterium]